jgi:hypothetical protein
MPVITDFHRVLSADDLLHCLGQAAERPEVNELAHWAMDEAQRLVTPAIVYERFNVRALDSETFQVGDALLHLGPHADLLTPAREALVSVCTIGPALEERVQTLLAEERLFEGYLLDTAGVIALAVPGEPLRCVAEEEAAKRGWGISPALSPGSLAGWTVNEQRTLCALLELSAIGVAITDAGILSPQKSGAGLVGIGPDYTAKSVGSTCHLCRLRYTCQFRH